MVPVDRELSDTPDTPIFDRGPSERHCRWGDGDKGDSDNERIGTATRTGDADKGMNRSKGKKMIWDSLML